MAYQDSSRPYQQLHPTLTPGYHYENKYHNIGQLRTPYIGKIYGQGGDYAPPQRTRYYTPQNPTYPYVMDKDFNPVQFLPTEGSCFGKPGYSPCYNGQYPDVYVPPDYFSPHTRYPSGHQPSALLSNKKENYTRDLREKLPVTYPILKGDQNFAPFNNYY